VGTLINARGIVSALQSQASLSLLLKSLLVPLSCFSYFEKGAYRAWMAIISANKGSVG
jgi:hypothetical protein